MSVFVILILFIIFYSLKYIWETLLTILNIKNIKVNPDVRIQVGRKFHNAIGVILDQKRSSAEILDYASRNPALIKILAKSLLGYKLGDEKGDLLELAGNLQVVRFHTIPEN